METVKAVGAANTASAGEVEVAGSVGGNLVAVGGCQGVDLGDLQGAGNQTADRSTETDEEWGDDESTVFTYGGDNQAWEHHCDGDYVPKSEPGGLEMMQLEAKAHARKLRHERGHLYVLGENGNVKATLHIPKGQK
jgi:hypothetical protein